MTNANARATPMLAPALDMSDVTGHEHVKRAIEVAAAGGHNIVMTGGPGHGKTMIARAMHGLLPDGESFVAPPAGTANAKLVGLLRVPGLVLLDNLHDYKPLALRTLVAALDACTTVDARPIVVATQRPCGCGYHGDAERMCTCTGAQVVRFQRRMTDDLLARFALHVDVPRVPAHKLTSPRRGEATAAVRARVLAARAVQAHRLGAAGATNGAMSPADAHTHCVLDEPATRLMQAAQRQLALSARDYHRTMLVARTIADLAGAERLGAGHIAEALQYRPRG